MQDALFAIAVCVFGAGLVWLINARLSTNEHYAWLDIGKRVRNAKHEATRKRVSRTLHEIIREALYCYRCNSRVTVDNCTGWDEDGNVWCDCNGQTPLVGWDHLLRSNTGEG